MVPSSFSSFTWVQYSTLNPCFCLDVLLLFTDPGLEDWPYLELRGRVCFASSCIFIILDYSWGPYVCWAKLYSYCCCCWLSLSRLVFPLLQNCSWPSGMDFFNPITKLFNFSFVASRLWIFYWLSLKYFEFSLIRFATWFSWKWTCFSSS